MLTPAFLVTAVRCDNTQRLLNNDPNLAGSLVLLARTLRH